MKILLPLENLQYDFPVPDTLNDFHHDSIAKICPFCLKTWAIIQHRSQHFSVQGTLCRTCWTSRIMDRPDAWLFIYPNAGGWPGSLLDDCSRLGVQWEMIEYFPRELVEREFLLHLKVVK